MVEPTEEENEEVVSQITTNQTSVDNAIDNNPGVDVGAINSDVNNLSKADVQTKYKSGTTGGDIAEEFLKNKDDSIELIGKTNGLDNSGGSEGLLDETTAVGQKNVTSISTRFKNWVCDNLGIAREKTPEELAKELNDPTNQTKLDKLKEGVQKQIDKTKGTWKEKAFAALLALLSSIPGIISLIKGVALLEALKDLAKGMSSCNEVNYTAHTNKKLTCSDDGGNTLKNACACPNSDALEGICVDYNPDNKCGTYSYVYMELQWYDLLGLLLAGIGELPHIAGDFFSSILEWFKDNKYMLIGVIVAIFTIMIIYGLIKNNMFS
jgi:hypothetical protein